MHAIIIILVAIPVFTLVWNLRNDDFFNEKFNPAKS